MWIIKKQIMDFDFAGVKCKDFCTVTELEAVTEYVYRGIEGVYLIEVETGRGANIRHYIRNPM